MTKNDFLSFFFDLPPLVTALIVWLWGFGSLLLYGFKTKAIKSVVLKTQGIIIGDFLIIPTIAYMITYFYQTVEDPLPETVFPAWTSITCLISLILALISAIRFKLVNRWFFPHLIFYWFIAYILLAFLTKGIYQLIFGEVPPLLWAVWTFVLMGIVTHVIFGVKKTCLQATRDFR